MMYTSPTFLALDLGSTHFKAGLFDERLQILHLSTLDVQFSRHGKNLTIDPAWAVRAVEQLIREVTVQADPVRVAAIGIASMAESGLLVDPVLGEPVSSIFPWFDRAAEGQVKRIVKAADAQTCFLWSGILPGYKTPLARLLWLRDVQNVSLPNKVWLSTADFVLFSLTGQLATDYSLAGRTLAFRIDTKEWHADWLRSFHLPPALFPPANRAGQRSGQVTKQAAARTGLLPDIPVTIAGHDHVCAALAVGVTQPGPALDSMGTAEALLGAMPERPLTGDDYKTGLLYGCHVAEGQMYWMGALSTSGGSVEWLRSILGKQPLTYEELQSELQETGDAPGDILFLPYLNGSGAPHDDSKVRAAWIGLQKDHNRADLYKAVLEGCAYEMEYIRQVAEAVPGVRINRLIAIGGGTRNRRWLQIKADVSGQPIDVPAVSEAVLSGAAILAGAAAGFFTGIQESAQTFAAQMFAAQMFREQAFEPLLPDDQHHQMYQRIYENGYLAIQPALRAYSYWIAAKHERKYDQSPE